MKKIPQDIIGDIALLKFPRNSIFITKKIKAWIFLKKHNNIKTVLEKTEKFSGELRILKTRYLAGEKRFHTTYKENNCLFRFDVNKTYFSPRLSNERKIISEEVAKIAKKESKILVCFAGVGPYPITIAKELKRQDKKAEIILNELNKDACVFAEENIGLNRVGDYVKVVCGDVRGISKKIKKRFDIILMPRPNLEETFLRDVLKLSKKGTVIYYHSFGTKEKVIEEIKRDAGKKIGKIKIRKAGDIGPNIYRWQASFRVK